MRFFFKKFIILVVLLVIFLFFSFFLFYFLKLKKEKQTLEKIVEKIPAYFIPPDRKFLTYIEENPTIYRLLKREVLQPGIYYEVEKPRKEVQKEIYQKISENGWTAVEGSNQDEEKTIFKLRKEEKIIFVVLQGKEIENKTVIKILPVNREEK